MSAFDSGQPAFQSLAEIIGGKTKPFVYFIGAGLSQQANLPSWKQLRSALEHKATAIVRSLREKDSLLLRLDNARKEVDPWAAFEQLRSIMGPAEYRAAIREELSESERCNIPPAYQIAATLGYRGVISLNIDRVAARAFSQNPGMSALTVFSGRQAVSHSSVLEGIPRFLAQLHGTLDDDHSWVFTQSDLNSLRETRGYARFLEYCMARFTLVFIGVTVDDIAVGGPLSDLAGDGFTPAEHFWITDRTDSETDRWAQQRNVRLIRYDAPNGDHAALTEVLRLLQRHVPAERNAAPVVPTLELGFHGGDIPDPQAILSLGDEQIRSLLNKEAARILATPVDDAMERYQKFLRDYDKAVYRSWYINIEPPNNEVFGYKLTYFVADGAFGTVYRAESPDGTACAVKVLNQSIRRQPGRLQSFRRGVEAMRILSQSQVKGMVRYKFATELPAMAVMEYVEGMNLEQIVDAGIIRDWSQVLRIASELCEIVREAHGLPQRVLHRDIRPANVMIRNGAEPETEWAVVVLDFDLCWYLDAGGQSIQEQSSLHGYLAPEIVKRESKVSTRSALIDSFGLGMTLYFLRTGRHPRASEHTGANWEQDLHARVESLPSARWRSLPRRFARLVQGATKDRQAERLDMARLQTEINRLRAAERKPREVEYPDLVAEELATRSASMRSYVFDANTGVPGCKWPTGMSSRMIPDYLAGAVVLEIEWEATGVENRTGLAKYVPGKVDRARAVLQREGWNVLASTAQNRRVTLRASIAVQRAVADLEATVRGLDSAIGALDFA